MFPVRHSGSWIESKAGFDPASSSFPGSRLGVYPAPRIKSGAGFDAGLRSGRSQIPRSLRGMTVWEVSVLIKLAG